MGRRRYERRRQKQDAALEAAALHLNERRTKAKEPAGRRRYEKRTQHSPDFRASTVRRGGASGTAGAHGRVNPFVPQGKPALPFAEALRVNRFAIHEKAGRECSLSLPWAQSPKAFCLALIFKCGESLGGRLVLQYRRAGRLAAEGKFHATKTCNHGGCFTHRAGIFSGLCAAGPRGRRGRSSHC